MPTYEYRCTACGHTLELFQRITAPAITRCPKCSGSLERLIGTGVGVIFKGPGFYATDHRSEDYKKKA
ncbi:MAG: zinc ribbon domain-containing protein, partial [Candidatus Eisenbacteria bacterium]|nr:zinc ribbon domain-containing protein [Candidatus Eisenbacteria bacterium]